MKPFTFVVILLFSLGLSVAVAGGPPHDGHSGDRSGMGKEMMGKGMDDERMQERMQRMEALMERIRATDDPAERRRLMQEHREAMRSAMGNMRDMRRKGMKGDMPMERRHEMMQRRMERMEQMMEQMMEHMMQGQE